MEKFIFAASVVGVLTKAILIVTISILVIKFLNDPYMVGDWVRQLTSGFEGVLK